MKQHAKKVVKTKRNPYLGELYIDIEEYQEIRVLQNENYYYK